MGVFTCRFSLLLLGVRTLRIALALLTSLGSLLSIALVTLALLTRRLEVEPQLKAPGQEENLRSIRPIECAHALAGAAHRPVGHHFGPLDDSAVAASLRHAHADFAHLERLGAVTLQREILGGTAPIDPQLAPVYAAYPLLALLRLAPPILWRLLRLAVAALTSLPRGLTRWRLSWLSGRRSLERFFGLVLPALLPPLRVSTFLIFSHFATLWLPLRIAASAPPFFARRLAAWRRGLVRFQALPVRRRWRLGGLFRPSASLLAPLPFSGLILALELAGPSLAAAPISGDSLVLRNVVQVLPAWLEPLIAALRWGRKIGLCRSIHFTCALANAPPFLTNLLRQTPHDGSSRLPSEAFLHGWSGQHGVPPRGIHRLQPGFLLHRLSALPG